MTEENQIPSVSILMAVYNTEEFIPVAIDSVLEQTYQQWELICINDGSTDNSLALLQRYHDKDARIIVVDRPHCGTCAGAKNAGLAVARGQYITMLDSDDKIEPAYLEKIVSRQQETQADIVISSICYWNHVQGKISCNLRGIQGDTSKIISGREAFILSLHWQISGNGLHRADILRQVRYCETGWYGDEYTTRLLFVLAEKVAFCDANYYYRDNQNSITKKFSFKKFSTITTKVMLLTLMRKNKFDHTIYHAYKEEIILAMVVNYANFLKNQARLSGSEKKIVLRIFAVDTLNLIKEICSGPVSIKSSYRTWRQLFGLLRSRARRLMASCD